MHVSNEVKLQRRCSVGFSFDHNCNPIFGMVSVSAETQNAALTAVSVMAITEKAVLVGLFYGILL